MQNVITDLSIYIEERENQKKWDAYFCAVWGDGSCTTWDVTFDANPGWIAGDTPVSEWVGEVLRAATQDASAVVSLVATPAEAEAYRLHMAAVRACNEPAPHSHCSHPPAPLLTGGSFNSALGDVSRETDA